MEKGTVWYNVDLNKKIFERIMDLMEAGQFCTFDAPIERLTLVQVPDRETGCPAYIGLVISAPVA